MRRLIVVMLLASLLGTLLPLSAVAQEESPDYAAGRALVGVKSKDKAKAEASIQARGGKVKEYYAAGDLYVVETPSDSAAWASSIKRDDGVRFAEPDYEVTADLLPTDPRYSELWGMQKISMPLAWDRDTGSNNVVVGVIDTGVDYNHPELASQMWTNPAETANGLDDDGNGIVDDIYGKDCRNNDGNPMDDNEHGTHVAGTIGAAANNGIGVAGVNWDVSIMALKFLSSSGSGYTSDAIECIDYAISKGADLTSNSWGGGGFSTALSDAINRARAADQLFLAAAGNSGANTDSSPHYPSSYTHANIISVAASTSSDGLASFSNYGATSVDLAAPGVGILSTVPGGGYESWNGTSMATPHVAGAAALLLSEYPGSSYVTLRDKIFENVDPIAAFSGKMVTGGRLNVAEAIVPPDDAPVVTALSPPSGSTHTGVTSVALSATATDNIGVTKVEFFVDNASVGVDTTAGDGWTATWNLSGVTDGSHTLKAVATDTIGQTGSRSHSVTVDNIDDPPQVAITSPAANSTVAGSVVLQASASDDRDAITSVQFRVDGATVGTDTSASGGWTYTWNSATVNDGLHNLTAVASTGSQSATSSAVSVRVDNVKKLHVHDLDGSRTKLSNASWRATVTITVYTDEETNAGSGVTVSIRWTTAGGSTSTGSCQTSSSGTCSVSSPKLSRKSASTASVTAQVTNLAKSGWTYAATSNHNVDGDGNNGTSITITKI